jgi:hypothetical protein
MFPATYATRSIIAVFITARHLFLSWVSLPQPANSHSISLNTFWYYHTIGGTKGSVLIWHLVQCLLGLLLLFWKYETRLLRSSCCLCVCICFSLSLLGNDSLNAFPQQSLHIEQQKNCLTRLYSAVHVVSKENRQLKWLCWRRPWAVYPTDQPKVFPEFLVNMSSC